MACTDTIPARYVLCITLFFGFMVVFLLRANLSVAIVAMVKEPLGPSGDPLDESSSTCVPVNRTIGMAPTSSPGSETPEGGDFVWDEFQQSVILGSFFWGYLFFQVPGGRMAEIHGTKRVFGLALLVNGILCFPLPFAAKTHWTLLLLIRALQGLAQGVIFPAMNAMVVRWVPVSERALFIALACQGVSLGTLITMPLCAWIIIYWGWESVFYFSGIVSLIWTTAWWFLVFDTPEQHPRLGPSERSYLAENLDHVAGTGKGEHMKVPWKDVLSCTQFWLGNIASFGSDWSFHTFMTLGPKYMKGALGFDLQQSSWLLSVPYLTHNVFALIYGAVTDYMTKRFPLSTVRRISVVMSHLVPTIGLLVLSVTGCNQTLAVVVLTLSITVTGSGSSGFFQMPMDTAPNFAGLLTGFMNGMGSVTGVICTPLAGALLQSSGVLTGWRYIFLVAAGMYLVSGLPFVLFYKAEVQSWNKGSSKDTANDTDLNQISSPVPDNSIR